MRPLPSIRDVMDGGYRLHERFLTEEERNAEDLNDRKCAWLVAATSVPAGCLTEREREFVERYRAEGITFSPFWGRKPEITAFLKEKVIEYKSRIK